MRRLPPLAAVRVFEAAARHENFTSAAAELGMTQAAVSYQVKLLEERLNASLFRREKKRVTLTDLGRRIAPLVSSAFDSMDDAFAIARRDSEAVLTISCASTFGPHWMAPRIGAFQMSRPELAVRLHTSDSLIDFARDDIDAAVRSGSGEWPGLCAHFLMRMPVGVFASPDYLASRPPVTTADQVMALDRISPDDSWWDLWRGQTCARLPDAPRRGGIRLDSQIMEGRAALAGHGAAVLNPLYWSSDIAAGRLVQVFDAIAWNPTVFWLVYPEHRRGSPKIRAFRDWVLGEAAREAATDAYGAYVQPDPASPNAAARGRPSRVGQLSADAA